MAELSSLNLTISSVNVNSFNVSTLHCANAKGFLKIEGITGKKADIILICDCRLGGKKDEIIKLLNLTRNGSYKLYVNSTREARGVAIAIKREIIHEIEQEFLDVQNENYLILKMKIKGVSLAIGVVYGPNQNSPIFFQGIKDILRNIDVPFILGGDFNTILDRRDGISNLDRIGEGRIPNSRNSEFITSWIDEGNISEPYRLLYPLQREISYIPFRARRLNRVNGLIEAHNYGKSRLDFYLVDNRILNSILEVKYEDRLGRDFDHREVTLQIGKKVRVGQINIRDNILNDVNVNYFGLISIHDTINEHKINPSENVRVTIGRLEQLVRQKSNIINCGDREIIERLENLEREINVSILELPPINEVLGGEFTCDYKTLYEVATMNLKNRLVAYQVKINTDNMRVHTSLLDDIKEKLGTYGLDSIQWLEAQDRLLQHNDTILKEKTGKYREFFNDNNEKMGAKFCKLGKRGMGLDNLTQIKNRDGTDFESNKKRGEYVTGFYSELYKKKLDRLIAIEDFLGREAVASNSVRTAKLTELEREDLEGEITEHELLESLNNSNLSSSNGWDGISYKTIKKYWASLGALTTRMANESMRDGIMTESFRLGMVKLIPKKGDCSRIEDWRPITLLSCGYKILSGVVAARLEKNLSKLIGRAQKGFLKHKNINTVTLNVINNITNSWHNKEELGILCVDFNKAFDSIEHVFITSVLRFFNYGPYMINMVETILKERQACIKLEDGFGEKFKIGRSTPQGDRASPYIFILCVEVLLMKLSYESGRRISMCNYMSVLSNKFGIEAGLAEAYADDITVMFKYNAENLQYILATLDLFHLTSGLSVNLSKTQLMVSGSDRVQINSKIHGVTVVEKIKVLGIEIDRKVVNLDANWRKVVNKIQNIVMHWSGFRLSITGRVGIVKTFMLSQCIYLMNCIPMSVQIGNEINSILIDYVRGGDRPLARNRAFNKIEIGGYGLIDILILNTAIKASWVKRWIKENEYRDYAGRLVLGSIEMVEKIGSDLGMGDTLLLDITEKWCSFLKEYYRYNGNWTTARIFGNSALVNGVYMNREQLHWEQVLGMELYRIMITDRCDTQLSELLDANLSIKQKPEIENILGVHINHAVYFRLRGAVTCIVQHYRNVNNGPERVRINDWLNRVKKGSGKFREFLDGKKSGKYINFKAIEIPAAITLWGQFARVENEQLIRIHYATWGVSQLSADFKNFLFRLINGKLYLNNVLAHIDNVDGKCTFCKINMNRGLNDRGILQGDPEYLVELNRLNNETIEHLFYSCISVHPILNEFCRLNLGMENNINWEYYMLGRIEIGYEKTLVKILILHFIKYYIYQCRTKKIMPSLNTLIYEFGIVINQIRKKSSLIPYCRNLIQLFL